MDDTGQYIQRGGYELGNFAQYSCNFKPMKNG